MSAAGLACLAGCTLDRARGSVDRANVRAPITTATVESVIDGDTVEVTIDGQRERVRLLGVDAPESVAPSVPRQCHGSEAALALAELLPPGTTVGVARDVEARDRYGRLLLFLYRQEPSGREPDDPLPAADVLRPDDDTAVFVNRWLVEQGHADAVSYEPNVAHATDFIRARNAARSAGVGLWGHCDGPDQPLE